MSHNKFLSFHAGGDSTSSSRTFIIEANVKILSIEIKATDTIIELPEANTAAYDVIQYVKNLPNMPRNVEFQYKGFKKGIIYNHRLQSVKFHKFKTVSGVSTWIL